MPALLTKTDGSRFCSLRYLKQFFTSSLEVMSNCIGINLSDCVSNLNLLLEVPTTVKLFSAKYSGLTTGITSILYSLAKSKSL